MAASSTSTSIVLRPIPSGETHDQIQQGLIAGIREEIRAVIDDLKRWGGDRPVRIWAGTYEGLDESHSYRVEIERPLTPPENTGVTVRSADGEAVRGWVDEVENDGRVLWLNLEDPLTSNPEGCSLVFDPTWVLEATLAEIERVSPDSDHPGLTAVMRMLGLAPAHVALGPELPDDVRGSLNDDQYTLLRTIVGSDLVIGFGPPGTGKTRAGAAAVTHLARDLGLRVLVVAHTNAALDTLLSAVVGQLPSWVEEGRIVRSGRLSREFRHLGIGYRDFRERAIRVHEAEIRAEIEALEAEADLVLGPAAPHRTFVGRPLTARMRRKERRDRERQMDIVGRLDALDERLIGASEHIRGQQPMLVLQQRLADLRRRIQEGVGQPEKTARIVGATFSKLAIEPDAFNRYDAVVADEASMAMLAQLVLAASRAEQKLVVLGDPKQLPPVVQSRGAAATCWLKRNLYQHLGIAEASTDDPRVVLLRTQYRMCEPVRRLVSDTFYSGLLVDAPEIRSRGGNVELRLLDTSGYGYLEPGAGGTVVLKPNQSQQSGKSRVNPSHAQLVSQLVRDLHDQGENDIAIITPFSAQAKAIREALRYHRLSGGFWAAGGTVSTIHRAQGGERDVVIIDLVDAPAPGGGTRGMSSFLDASWNTDLPNLVNVAISRARRRLIVIAHARGFRARYGPGSLIFDLLARIYREGHYERVEPPEPPEWSCSVIDNTPAVRRR